MDKKLIYCVDDEEAIREVYEYALSQNYDVKTFADDEELFSALKVKLPDLFILDIMLEGLDGYEILARLKLDEKTTNIPVIMVSAKTTEIDKVRGLNLGADDYLVKPFGVLELNARINAKLRSINVVKKQLKYKDIAIDEDRHVVTICGKEVTTTLKQYELLKLFIENSEKVLNRDDILDKVWGENYGETRTLDIHIGDLRKMLKNTTCEIATIRGVGYILK